MSILPIAPVLSAAGAAPVTPPDTTATSTGGGGFGDVLGKALDAVNGIQATADTTAVQAATGTAANIHDVMIAATEAQLATSLTTTVRDKAVAAFTSIMQMPV